MSYHDIPIREFVKNMVRASGTPRLLAESEARALSMKLHAFSIVTVGDFWGCLHPELPSLRKTEDAVLRGIYKEHLRRGNLVRRDSTIVKKRIAQLAFAIHYPVKLIERIYSEIDQMPPLYLDSKPARAEWFLGQQVPLQRKTSQFIQTVTVRSLPHFKLIAPSRQITLLPDLNKRLGRVWDQGQRGTCVAQAAGGLISYLTGGFDPSIQFIYHQCKLIDGLATQEGTHLYAALRVLSDRQLSRAAQFWNGADMGVPRSSAWPYVPHFQVGNPAQTPPPEKYQTLLYGGERAFNAESKTSSAAILRCSTSKQRVVDDIRFLIAHLKVPVIAGFPLYESFNNQNSRRTGKITLPLPGEMLMGWHAMLIVGFDDAKQCVVVRNSWGKDWAWGCSYADEQPLAGHAIIPYAYFQRSDIKNIDAYAIERGAVAKFNVHEQLRLYRNSLNSGLFNKEESMDIKCTSSTQKLKGKPSVKPKKNVREKTKTTPNFFDFLRLR